MKAKLTIALVTGILLFSCDHSKSQKPGSSPPGAGAGQRGGANDGTAAGKTGANAPRPAGQGGSGGTGSQPDNSQRP